MNQPLPRSTLLIFCLPAMVQGLMSAPAASITQGVYAKHAGLALTALGTAVIAVRIFDAVTDPLIGMLSDAWYRRRGTRKPFMVAGTCVSLIGLWALYRPPPEPTILYFTTWFMMTYLGWTIFEIPYRAWSMELSSDYAERTRIQTMLGMMIFIGVTLFFLVPIGAKAIGWSPSSDFDFGTLALTATVTTVFLPLAAGLTVWCVPDGEMHEEKAHVPPRELFRAVVQNGPLLYFIAIFLTTSLTGNLSQGVTFLYFDTYLGLGEELAAVMLLVFPLTIIGIPFWGWVCQRYERQKVWAVATAGTGVAALGFEFVSPGGSPVPVVVILALTLFCVSCTVICSLAMIGDVVDYGRWKFGADHAGMYIATYTILNKSAVAVAIGIGFLIFGQAGFDATAEHQSESAVLGVRAVMSWIPAAGALLVAPFVWFYPLNRARHAEIVREIEIRERTET